MILTSRRVNITSAIRALHMPTSSGLLLVHALGSSVSKALEKPWMTLKAVTPAVIDPKVDPASAAVEI